MTLRALAALVAMLLAPILGDAAGCAAARACATAPCCIAKTTSCPMHQQTEGCCRMRSCGEHEVSVAQTPPVVHSSTLTVTRFDARAVAISGPEVAMVANITPPPEPPPPRPLECGDAVAALQSI